MGDKTDYYIGNKIYEIRNKHKLTQAEMGQILGLAQATIGWFEQHRNYPSYLTIKKICNEFGVSADELLGLERR